MRPPPGPVFRASTSALTAVMRARMTGVSWYPGCPVPLDERLSYRGFDHAAHRGELIVNASAADMTLAFGQLFAARFPIRQLRVAEDFGGDDERSIVALDGSAVWRGGRVLAVIVLVSAVILLGWGTAVLVRAMPGWWRLLAVPAAVAVLWFVLFPLTVAVNATNRPGCQSGPPRRWLGSPTGVWPSAPPTGCGCLPGTSRRAMAPPCCCCPAPGPPAPR